MYFSILFLGATEYLGYWKALSSAFLLLPIGTTKFDYFSSFDLQYSFDEVLYINPVYV